MAANNALVLIDYLHPRVIEVIADLSGVRSREIPWRLSPAVPKSICPAWGRKVWMTTLTGDFDDELVLVDLDDGSHEPAKVKRGWEPPLLMMAGGSLIIKGGESPVLYDSSTGCLQWLQADLTVFSRITLAMNETVGLTAEGDVIVLERDNGSWLLRRFDMSANLTAVQRLENVPWRMADGVASLDEGVIVVMGDSGELFVSASHGKPWSRVEADYASLFYDAMKEQSRKQR